MPSTASCTTRRRSRASVTAADHADHRAAQHPDHDRRAAPRSTARLRRWCCSRPSRCRSCSSSPGHSRASCARPPRSAGAGRTTTASRGGAQQHRGGPEPRRRGAPARRFDATARARSARFDATAVLADRAIVVAVVVRHAAGGLRSSCYVGDRIIAGALSVGDLAVLAPVLRRDRHLVGAARLDLDAAAGQQLGTERACSG